MVIKNGNQINLKEDKNNNQGFLKLTSYFDSLNSLTFYYLLFFRCQLYVFCSCVDKCLRATVIFLLLSNTLKMIVFHSASTVDDKHLSTQLQNT
jgi:hypothetical protein